MICPDCDQDLAQESLGRLLEIWLDQKIDDNQKLVFHYGRAWGGQVVGATFPNS